MAFYSLSFCTGLAGLELAVSLVCPGVFEPALYVEREISVAEIIAARIEEGSLPAAPIWSGVKTVCDAEVRAYIAHEQASRESDSSQPATHASHSPALVSVVERAILATCGLGSLTPLIATARPASSSRMSQGILFSDTPKSVEISKTEAIAWRRVYSRRKKLAIRTSGSGCSSSPWPTPDACLMQLGETPETFAARQELMKDKHANGNGMGTPLAMSVQQWCTPGAMGGGSVSRGGDQILSSPPGLPPAMTCSDGSERSPSAPGSPPPSLKRKLNFAFDEWLMGLPLGMSGSGPVEMQPYLSRQRQLLCSYLRRISNPSGPEISRP